ncbi:hypothetical protein DFQ28_007491 [Apophysomyces sp. BC1034]|nr:hypothetical protein DFQ30_007422 [Apophysomyces sp. BC1015]KAG0176226.1 hypothetical protein DFQ29_006398 [Apophysomyces sp. BC1021]KAG0186657.1 hypothetical protein DFQ28_007491 [Apophysomyces sp. BC1034]
MTTTATMPSEKFRISTAGRSIRQAANSFLGAFQANPVYTMDTSSLSSATLTFDEGDLSSHIDRRSAHNALERQRRENLNSKFQQLAHVLPALQTVRRPSKTMIVAKSLEFVSSSLRRETDYRTQIQELRKENELLRKKARASSLSLKKTAGSTASSSTLSKATMTTASLISSASTDDSTQPSSPTTPLTHAVHPVSPPQFPLQQQQQHRQQHQQHQQHPLTCIEEHGPMNDCSQLQANFSPLDYFDVYTSAASYMETMYDGRDQSMQQMWSSSPLTTMDAMLFSPYYMQDMNQGGDLS